MSCQERNFKPIQDSFTSVSTKLAQFVFMICRLRLPFGSCIPVRPRCILRDLLLRMPSHISRELYPRYSAIRDKSNQSNLSLRMSEHKSLQSTALSTGFGSRTCFNIYRGVETCFTLSRRRSNRNVDGPEYKVLDMADIGSPGLHHASSHQTWASLSLVSRHKTADKLSVASSEPGS